MAESIHKMLVKGIDIWAPKLTVKRVVVDFSSPNIAKELHVGHLRSTIIGDTIARLLEFSKADVLRINHVGDWGTQFGMLIEYLFQENPNFDDASEIPLKDLQAFYKKSKKRFTDDEQFKEAAQKAVVKLQGGDPRHRKVWTQICEISRKGFESIYQRLGVKLEEKGESFYNPFIPGLVEALSNLGLVAEKDGAQVIYMEDSKKYLWAGKKDKEDSIKHLMVVKKDGAFGYDSTDLAALWYRLNEEKAEWIIYVTDVNQQEHFDMAAKRAGWLPLDDNLYPKATHVGFGLVVGEDGKPYRTRSAEENPSLVGLLDKAKDQSKEKLVERLIKHGKDKEWTSEELEQTAKAIGYGAVKYADLKNNMSTSYAFNFDQMLKDKGNTAVYLLYTHARICSIIRRSSKDIEELKKTAILVLGQDERALALHLVQFPEIVQEACTNLLPHVLCEYLYNLSEQFNNFYEKCKVVGCPEEDSRVLLCEATVVVMRKCFFLLGIEPVYRL